MRSLLSPMEKLVRKNYSKSTKLSMMVREGWLADDDNEDKKHLRSNYYAYERLKKTKEKRKKKKEKIKIRQNIESIQKKIK